MANGLGTVVFQEGNGSGSGTRTIQMNNVLLDQISLESRLAILDRIMAPAGTRSVGGDILDVLLAGIPFGIVFAVVWFGRTPQIVLDLLRK